MGIACVMFGLAILLTCVACLVAAGLAFVVHLITRGSTQSRKWVIAKFALFPFACLAFAGVWFIAYGVINEKVFDRDPGIGDAWRTPPTNGYELLMIDIPDDGTVYNPKTQPSTDGVVNRSDALFGVAQLQVADQLIFGGRDTKFSDHFGRGLNVDSYFALDAGTNVCRQFATIEELRAYAADVGVKLQLRPVSSVYYHYRYTWFDIAAVAVLLLVPTTAFIFLIWSARKFIRRDSTVTNSNVLVPPATVSPISHA